MAPRGQLYIDRTLTNVAVAYKNTSLIADLLLPVVTVPDQSGKVWKFGKDAFRLESDIRAPGTKSSRVQSFSASTDTYFCNNHALTDVVPEEDLRSADVAIAAESSATEGLVDMIKLRREKSLADYLFNATTFSSYTSALSGADRWGEYTSSDPVANAESAIEAVRQKSGAKANLAVMGSAVYIKLRRHPQLLDMFKYTAGGVLSESQVAEALGVGRILVGSAIYESAKEGAASSMADVWGKYCLFAYVAPQAGIRKPSLGYSYRWNVGIEGYKVFKTEDYSAGGIHGTAIEVMTYFDDVVHGADFGYLYSTVVS